MSFVRLNITLPESLALKLNTLAGPRAKSKFITAAVKEKIEELEESALKRGLEEGYRARSEEALGITKEFEGADLEGWDEY